MPRTWRWLYGTGWNGEGMKDCLTCSASARLILFLLIISFLLRTFIAYSLSVFFSLTRYTFPTSPLPSSLIFTKLAGPTSTFLILIEFDEYVRLNACRGDCTGDPPFPIASPLPPIEGEFGVDEEVAEW